MLKFLRRDPTVWITLAQAGLGLALAFHLFGLTQTTVPLIMAVINAAAGLITAIYTKRAGFAFAMGLVTAVINLFAGYGLTLTDEKTNAILLFVTVALGLFGWTANSPADDPGLHEEPMSPGTVVNQTIVSSAAEDLDVQSPYTPPSVGGGGY
jgi:hypothetical protein